MNYATSFQEREGGTTIRREAELNIGSLEENYTRLRSWASIMGVGLSGSPFVIVRDGVVNVGVQTKKPTAANPETGVHPGEVPGGMSLCIEDVPLASLDEVTAQLPGEFGDAWTAAGAVEFHRSKDGFGRGTVVVPLQPAAGAAGQRQEAGSVA
jgi:hypothetical protein